MKNFARHSDFRYIAKFRWPSEISQFCKDCEIFTMNCEIFAIRAKFSQS